MKSTLSAVQAILVIISLSVIVCIIAVSIYSFSCGKAELAHNLRKADPTAEEVTKQFEKQSDTQKTAVFSGIGRIRAATKDDPIVPVVIEPYFPYDASDIQFYEEISKKSRRLAAIVVQYFSQRTMAELLQKGELNLKQDLIELFNEEFVLGKIDKMYFSEYMFFE